LAVLREIYDGHWERNVGIDGGRTLTWTGRVTVVGACTTAWDSAHGVISIIGDRFVLIRSDSTIGREEAGNQAIRNTGLEQTMRAELATVVGGLIGHINTTERYDLDESEIKQLIKATNIVTHVRRELEALHT
jgi:hypothetical protein